MAIGAYTKTTWANSPATTSPVSTANLQHIEDQVKDITDAALTEGTWTPTLIGSTTAGTQTYSVQVGTYIKIGKLIHIQGYVAISAKDAAMAGDLRVGGLPFATSTATNNYGSISTSVFIGLTLGSGLTQVGLRIDPNTSYLTVVASGSATAAAVVTVANTATTAYIAFGGTYISAS